MSEKKKILVVDDSKTALFMVMTILKKTPYDLVTAHDGQQALEVAAAERPDLILMDVVMPRMTGFEACRELKQREDTKRIPVILVTTRGEEENVERRLRERLQRLRHQAGQRPGAPGQGPRPHRGLRGESNEAERPRSLRAQGPGGHAHLRPGPPGRDRAPAGAGGRPRGREGRPRRADPRRPRGAEGQRGPPGPGRLASRPR